MVEYAAKRPLADAAVIGNNDPGRGLISAQHHVAAALATEYEAGALQCSADLPAGQISRKLGH